MPEENYVLPFDLKLDNIVHNFSVKPKRYHLELAPYFQKNDLTFDGEVSIDFESLLAKPALKLHAKNLEILGKIVLKKGDEVYESSDYKIEIDNEESVLTIDFDRELPIGDYNLKIKYRSNSNYSSKVLKHVSYTDNSGRKEWILMSNFGTEGTQEMFPCWNDDLSRSKFAVSIKHIKTYTALCNASPKDTELLEDDPYSVWTTFKEPAVAFAPHQLAFIVGNLELMSAHNNDPFRLWLPKNTIDCKNNDIRIIDKLWKALESITGITHKEHSFNKMDVVVLPKLIETKTCNWGLCTINDVNIGFKENIDKTEKVKTVTDIAASMIDHWFGELIMSVDYEKGSKLSYGLRLYLAELVVDKVYKTWRSIDWFINRQGQVQYRSDFHYSYIARTIHHIMGKENLQKALRNYILNNGPKNTIISPLEDELANAAGERKELMKKVFENWSKFDSFRELTVTRNYEENKVIITQTRSSSNTHSDRSYWAPLNWTNEQELDFEDTSVTHWYDGDCAMTEIPVAVPADQWIIVNKQHFGIYRVTYDEKNWKMIIKYLNSDNYSKIHLFNRIQLINDAFMIADWRFLDYSIPFELAKYLTRETEFAPWTAFLHYIEELYNKSPLRGSAYFDNFKKYVLEVTDELEKRILQTNDADDDFATRLLRIPLVSVRCIFGASACGNYALTKLKNWLEDPDKYPISADMKSVVLKSAIRFADEDTWYKLFDRYQLNLQSPINKEISIYDLMKWNYNKEEDILNALSCTSNFELLKKFIVLLPEKFPNELNLLAWLEMIILLNEKGIDAILDILDSKPTRDNGDLIFKPELVFHICSGICRNVRTEDQVQKIKRVRTQYSNTELNRFLSREECVIKNSISNFEKKMDALKTYFGATN